MERGFENELRITVWRYVFVADFEAQTVKLHKSLLDAETLKPALSRQLKLHAIGGSFSFINELLYN